MDTQESPVRPTYDELVRQILRYLAGNAAPHTWALDALHLITVAPLFGVLLLLGATGLLLGYILALPYRALRWVVQDLRKPYREFDEPIADK